MKTILEYLVNNHIHNNNRNVEDYFVFSTNKPLNEYVKVCISNWCKYITYEDLYKISKDELIMYLCEKHKKFVNVKFIKKDTKPTIQYYSNSYGSFVIGYFIDITHKDICNTTAANDNDFSKLKKYMNTKS